MILEQVTEQLAPFAVDARFTLRELIAKLEDVLICQSCSNGPLQYSTHCVHVVSRTVRDPGSSCGKMISETGADEPYCCGQDHSLSRSLKP